MTLTFMIYGTDIGEIYGTFGTYRVFINDFGKVWGSYMDRKAACQLEMVSSYPNS